MNDIRTLRADEIECRIGASNKELSGASLLLYKDARVDMCMLDEVFGATNWQRTHQTIDGRLYCTISVWDDDKKQWISKQDVGTESNTEKEKGQASDSFKRAAFNFGIGRELYTAPFIWVNLTPEDISNGKIRTKFFVREIGYKNREINHLVIVDGKGKARFTFGNREDDNLSAALEELNNAPDRKTLNQIWNKYNELQANKKFSDTCMKMCAKFPKQ